MVVSRVHSKGFTVMVTVMVTCPGDDESVAGDIVTPKSSRCCCSFCCIFVVIPHTEHMFKTIDLLHDGMVIPGRAHNNNINNII